MQFSPKQKSQFRRDGYLLVPGAVPDVMVRAARQRINAGIGRDGIDPDRLTEFRAQSYVPAAREEPVLTDLFNRSPLFPLVESLLGEGMVSESGSAQIALRFPRLPFVDAGPPGGHLDGLGSGANGQEVGHYMRGFTALVTIYLQDVPEPDHGNFTVWPGSHLTVEAHLKEHGHDVLADGQPELEWPRPPVQVTGRAGDAVISHHQIIHTAAPNTGPDIRYAAIFRVRSTMADEVGLDALTDIWREWKGLEDVEVDETPVGAY